MQKGFEIVDHTADVGIIAYSADMGQVFASDKETRSLSLPATTD